MSDVLTPLGVKTLAAGDVVAKIVDAGGTNQLAIDSSGRPTVNVNGAVDTELPAAASLGDSVANPTAPAVGSFLMAWNGSTWQRVKVNGSGEVVVTTSAGSPTAPKVDTVTSSALAAAANTTLNGTQVASGKTGKLMRVLVAAAVPLKIEVQTKLNGTPTTVYVAFTSAAHPTFDYAPPHKDFTTVAQDATAGLDAFCVKVTNLDPTNASDVYATISWDEV